MQSGLVLPQAVKLRQSSGIFPPALPAHYSFLQKPPIQHRINIKHPGYDEEDEDLFILYAWDHAEGGLHFGFVLDACTIVAGTRTDGYLSTTRGGIAIVAQPDDLLRAGNYYFHIPGPEADADQPPSTKPYRWPVVACFQDWPFPKNVPPQWSKNYFIDNASSLTSPQSTVTAAVKARDHTCRVSDHSTGAQVAHLVPQHESEWFYQNSMSTYNTSQSLDSENLLNDLGNLILLRPDLHTAFDERKFVFYPKGENTFVVHMLAPTPDLAQLYHNVEVHAPFNCHPNFVYAHLAWAIFPSLTGFWTKPGVKRTVLLRKDTDNGRKLVEEEIVYTPQFRARIVASRSCSPKKRQRAQETDTAEQVNEDRLRSKRPLSDTSSDYTHGAGSHADTDETFDQVDENGQGDTSPEGVAFSTNSHHPAQLEDDQYILSRFSPEALALCPSWYPGWRKIHEMREEWLRHERRKSQITSYEGHTAACAEETYTGLDGV